MTEAKWNLSVAVSGGPTLTVHAARRPAEAADLVRVTIEPGDADKVVEVQPGGATAIHLLVIQSSSYEPALTYVVSDGSTDSPDPVTLDAPHVFSTGSAALFGVAPVQLKFTNPSPSDAADVTIFVVRDATP